jgi:hypothetical protein
LPARNAPRHDAARTTRTTTTEATVSEFGANAGCCADKWLEFLATEPRLRAELQRAVLDDETPIGRMRRIEAHAGYWWLLAAALFTWIVS